MELGEVIEHEAYYSPNLYVMNYIRGIMNVEMKDLVSLINDRSITRQLMRPIQEQLIRIDEIR